MKEKERGNDMEINEYIEKLESLKKGDFIWVSMLHPLFKTYDNINSNSQYLGYDSGDDDADFDDSIYVLKAESPIIYAPTKMAFVAKVINSECKDDIAYVFNSDMHDFEWGNYYFGQYVIIPHQHFRGYKCQNFYLDAMKIDDEAKIDVKTVFFTEEDCIKNCREKNNNTWAIRNIDLIGKTLNSLKKQLNVFKKSELFVDAQKKIEEDLHAKDV